MNYRRWAHIAEWSLLVLVVALHALAAIAPRQSGMDAFDGLLFDSIPIAQLVLLVVWSVLGPGSVWLRIITGPLLIAAVLGLRMAVRSTGMEFFTPLLAATGTTTFMIVFGARLSGLSVRRGSPLTDSGGARFSVRSLFILTTVTAVLIGGLETLRPQLQATRDPFEGSPLTARAEFVRQMLMISVILSTSLGALWATLRPGTFWLRLALVGICGPTATWYVANLTNANLDTTLTLIVWNLAILAIIVVSLMPLRLMNYRLVRPCKAATSGRGLLGSAGASPSQLPAEQHAHASVGRGTQGESPILETMDEH